jgi:hypothetical protein
VPGASGRMSQKAKQTQKETPMTAHAQTGFADTDGDGRICAAEAMETRRALYADGLSSRAEVEALFALNDRVADDDPAWAALFVEAVCDYLLRTEAPAMHITAEESHWLQSLVTHDGKVEIATELEAIVRVLELAETAPADLSRFALEICAGRALYFGKLAAADVKRLERLLYAAGGHGAIAIDRTEAELLFRLNDGLAWADNDPAWDDLFARAISNHLMALAAPDMVPTETALAREHWLGERGDIRRGFLSGLFAGGLEGFASRVMADPRKDMMAAVDARERAAREAEAVTKPESAWLIERLRADKVLSRAEQALIDRLEGFHPGLGAALRQQV